MSRDNVRAALRDPEFTPGLGIEFIRVRDGEEAARAFARQTMVAYRLTILKYGRALTFYSRYLVAYRYAKKYVLGGIK